MTMGRFYGDWEIGSCIEHPIRRTVTETDNLLISALTHNPQPLHLDAEYAGGTAFGRIVVNSTFTFTLLVGLTVGETTLGTLVANLGFDKARTPRPVFVGDTLRTVTEVIDRRESRLTSPPFSTAPSTSVTRSCANATASRCSAEGNDTPFRLEGIS